jgi:hypothetical protein
MTTKPFLKPCCSDSRGVEQQNDVGPERSWAGLNDHVCQGRGSAQHERGRWSGA